MIAPSPASSITAASARRVSESDSPVFVVELHHYTGPLDLLLSLIRDEQVDIYDIPIARIAEQFLARIGTLGLDEAADYLELAARLLRIKAQMLLPRRDGEEGWEDPRAELVRRILEYQQMREVVDLLEYRGEERRNRFARQYIPQLTEAVPVPTVLSISLNDLMASVDRILRASRDPVVHDVVARALDVEGAMVTIRELLGTRGEGHWSDILGADAEPWQVLSVLLALLELAKLGELRIIQKRAFGAVEIKGVTVSEAA